MTRKRLERLHELLSSILSALAGGRGFSWGDGERVAYTSILRDAGIELATPTSIKRRGLRLKRGAKAVGSAYFGAPISSYGELYVVGVQTAPGDGRLTSGQSAELEALAVGPRPPCPAHRVLEARGLATIRVVSSTPYRKLTSITRAGLEKLAALRAAATGLEGP